MLDRAVQAVNSAASVTSPIAIWITALATAIIAVGTIVVAWTARLGLTTWQAQARAEHDHVLASRLLRRAYAIQRTVAHARELLTWGSDIAANIHLGEAERRDYGARVQELVLRLHGSELMVVSSGTLELDFREATIRWGVQIGDLYRPLIRATEEIKWTLGVSPFATGLGESAQTLDTQTARAWMSRWKEIVGTAGYSVDAKEIDGAVAAIEGQLQPYLRIQTAVEIGDHGRR